MKKILCLLLAMLLVLPLAVACNQDEKPPVSTGDSTGDTTAPDGTDPADTSPDDSAPSGERMHKVPTDELNFKNDQVVITAFDWQGYKYYFFAEEDSDDPMQSAIYNRRRTVEEAIGVTIKEVMYDTYKNMFDAMDQSIGSGDDSMQIVLTHCINKLSTYTSGGSLYPLDELPYIDLTADWWNTEAMSSLKLGSHYLLGANDYMLPCPYAIFFNKDMVTDLSLESPYDLVANNEWTIDKFEELARAAVLDVDSNGFDENDNYGISCQNGGGSTFLSFWSASEQFMAYKGEDGKLDVFQNTEKTQDICERIAEWSKDHLICPFPSGKSSDAIHMSTGQVLFWMSNIAGAEELRDTDVDYGIVPFPKYTSEQENYYSLDWGGLMVVPVTIREPEMVGATIELLAYGSDVEGGVIDTYYDLVLDGQLSQDPTAPEMLDILFDTICYDPGVTFWGLSGSYLQLFYYPWNYGVLKGTSEFSSFYASNKDSAQKFIDDYYFALEMYDDLFG